MSSYHGDVSKSSRSKVKPIFKKLTQSEKNSLDLDRPLEQQDGLGIFDYGGGLTSRSSHDIAAVRRGFHARSTSGTSQFSTATSTASANRSGSFVHPFQQTPRPYTPPLGASYQNSIRESEHSNDSPALTEEEDQLRHTFRSTANLSNHANSITGSTNPILQQSLRIQTKLPPSSFRIGLATSHTSLALSPEVTSPLDNMSPASPSIRSSIDKGFRIRSRSEVDTRLRSETIQEARRKLQEREKVKEEKAAREEIRAMEKRQQKEARHIEKGGHRQSSASESTATRSKRSKSDLTMREKGDELYARDYNTISNSTPPFITEEQDQPDRSHTAMSNTKKKTHSAWTKLMMWLRTRFIRLGKKRSRS